MDKNQCATTLKSVFPFLKNADVEFLLGIAQYRKLKNRETFIKNGKNAQNIFFILKGMVRGFYVNSKAEEKNVFLIPEHNFSGAPDSLFEQTPTKYSFESILESHVLIFNFNEFQKILITHPNVLKLYLAALHKTMQTLIFRVELLTDKSPEERYHALLKESPYIFQTAFNKHIANYLGMTPVSLSRIIKRQKDRGSEGK